MANNLEQEIISDILNGMYFFTGKEGCRDPVIKILMDYFNGEIDTNDDADILNVISQLKNILANYTDSNNTSSYLVYYLLTSVNDNFKFKNLSDMKLADEFPKKYVEKADILYNKYVSIACDIDKHIPPLYL